MAHTVHLLLLSPPTPMKPVYFLSDAHLGCLALQHRRTQERRLVNFLDSIKDTAGAVYLLGDIFDFWYEYKTVVPRGFTRLLGKLSELTDLGVEVHFFVGNHDLWQDNYLAEECGVQLHRKASTIEIGGKVFFLAHGDGLGTRDWKFRTLRAFFHSRICQVLFSSLHPRWGIAFGRQWARHSQLKHQRDGEPSFMGEEREELIVFSREYLRTHPEVNYFVFGHRHIELNVALTSPLTHLQADSEIHDTPQVLIIGDWISRFTFARFDGKSLTLHNYVEGETQL